MKALSLAVLVILSVFAVSGVSAGSSESQEIVCVPVVFTEGHRTDLVDGGRPVVLIAAALGVSSEVFREAFTHVRPAPSGTEPESGQVQDNKAALMDALAKYGVTNDRLDAVSNYYRYVSGSGRLWPTHEATANALVSKGEIVGFEVIDGGSGYSSLPKACVASFDDASITVGLSYGKNMKSNGSVSTLELAGK